MEKVYQILILILAIVTLCIILNRCENPFLKYLNNLNPIKSYKVYTYIEIPKYTNSEKKIQLLSKNDSIPVFLNLCIILMKEKIAGFNTDLVILTPENYLNYVNDLPISMNDISYPIKFRVDLLAAFILEKHGGLFLSPGTIIYKNIDKILTKVNSMDLVTFGGSQNSNSCSYNKTPSSFTLGSKHNSDFIKLYKKGLINAINEKIPSEFISETIMEAILENNTFNQYHFCCDQDGSRDINNRNITFEDFIGYEDIKFKNENKLLIIVFPYHKLYSNSEYKWFNILQENEFYQSNMYINNLFQKLLKI